MARSGKTWLWGCGAGCLAVVVLLVVLFGGGAFFLRDTLQGWQAASTAQEELRRVHGDAGSFRPDGDGGSTVPYGHSPYKVSTAGALTQRPDRR